MDSGQGLVWRGRVSVLSGAAGEGWGQLRAGKALSKSEAQAAGGEGGCVIAARSEADWLWNTAVTGGTAVTCLLQETYRRISRVDLRFPDDVQISKLGRLFIQQVGAREGPSRRSGGRGRGGGGDAGGLGRRGGGVSRSFRGGQHGGCRGGSSWGVQAASRGCGKGPAGGDGGGASRGSTGGQQGVLQGVSRWGCRRQGRCVKEVEEVLGVPVTLPASCLPPLTHSRALLALLHAYA